MKILIIHNRYIQYGGEDATFENELQLLKSNGNEVEVLNFDNKALETAIGKIQLLYKLFYNRESATKLDEIIQRFNPEIIHVHNFFYVASPSIFYVAKKHRVPIVVTLQNFRLICSGALLMRGGKICEICVGSTMPIHGIIHKCHKNSFFQSALLTLVTGFHKLVGTWNTSVSRYIAVTEFTRQKYINSSLKLKPNKIFVKPNSTGDHGFGEFQQRENYFLFVGRLTKEKGIDILLKAFKDSKYPLYIIGDGPSRSDVLKAVNDTSSITWYGHQGKDFIIEKMKRCRALIFPSIWYECLPVTILESFSTGTPVIISDIGNLNEIVSDKYNGLHFVAGDSDDLRKVTSDIAMNQDRYSVLYPNARKTYLDKYTHEQNFQSLMTVYNAAIVKF